MGTNEKSGQPVQNPEHRPDEHFATRRKILGGLVGAPVFLTFSQRAGAVESFGRCIFNEFGTDDLTGYFADGDGNIWVPEDPNACSVDPAFTSLACLTSFVVQAPQDKLPETCIPPSSA